MTKAAEVTNNGGKKNGEVIWKMKESLTFVLKASRGTEDQDKV